ncbi:AmmeMemoRadiSam system protein B [candidate division Kazan bacterium]|uniref:AmmeMemoRadiSam system protein B n=1 Tax=candidate division Kazan bacterium TaxID=2202143 RepID=A0A420ZCU8_UNCK3|nr:MAG: AmmeMemoRadiSam system protein B [candidate division Kazan bacterium]
MNGEVGFIAKLDKSKNNQWLVLTILGLAIVLMVIGGVGKLVPSYPYIAATWNWIFGQEGEYTISNNTRAVIVSHDYLSYKEINSFYRGLVKSVDPKTIIVLSPNHYERGEGNIQTTGNSFATIDGELLINRYLVRQLNQQRLATINNTSFINEHGITLQAGFIKHFFPSANIVPIILKQNVVSQDITNLVEWLHAISGEDVLIIASLDFSHYLSKTQADINDSKMLAIIQAFDIENLPGPDPFCPFVDSVSALNVLLQYAEGMGATDIQVIHHDNTADILNKPNLDSTTSHFYIAFS